MNRLQLVSYPKSGRSWVRYALTQLGHGRNVLFQHDGFEFNDGSRPPLDFDVARRRTVYAPPRRVVYLAREPRDIIVSLFHQITGRFRDFFGFQGDISAFIRDDYFGAHNLHRFQQMWDRLCSEGVALKVSYEECHADFQHTLARIVGHYGLDVDAGRLRMAAEAASFENMREVESSGAFPEPWLRLRNGAPKVRQGKVAGYLDVLSPIDIAYLDGVFSGGSDQGGATAGDGATSPTSRRCTEAC